MYLVLGTGQVLTDGSGWGHSPGGMLAEVCVEASGGWEGTHQLFPCRGGSSPKAGVFLRGSDSTGPDFGPK